MSGRRMLVALALMLVSAAAADAQIIDSRQVGTGEPVAWTSLSLGWLQHGGLCDPDSNSCWNFGSAPQFRATFDMPVGRGATVGLAGTTSRVPLVYDGGLLSGCNRCDADANVSQILGNLRIGDGNGLHQVIDISAGMTIFSNFRTTTNGTKLDPARTVSSFTFGVGYGVGYSLSRRFQMFVVQDWGLVIHKRMSGQTNNTANQTTTRIGARYGMGSRRRGF